MGMSMSTFVKAVFSHHVLSGTRIPRFLFDHVGWGEWELQIWRLPGEGNLPVNTHIDVSIKVAFSHQAPSRCLRTRIPRFLFDHVGWEE